MVVQPAPLLGVSGLPVELDAYAAALVEIVQVAGPAVARDPGLPSRAGESVRSLYPVHVPLLKERVHSVADLRERGRQLGPPGHLFPCPHRREQACRRCEPPLAGGAGEEKCRLESCGLLDEIKNGLLDLDARRQQHWVARLRQSRRAMHDQARYADNPAIHRNGDVDKGTGLIDESEQLGGGLMAES